MNRRPIVRNILRIGFLLTGILLVVAWHLYRKEYAEFFFARKGALARHELQEAGGDSIFSRSWLTLHSSSGLRVDCGLLAPRTVGRRFPAIVVLGGKATGKYAIDYALDISNAIIVAVDYPYEPLASYTLFSFLADVPAMRAAILDMVPSVMLLTDYLGTRADVDSTKIVLLGYSFGAPLVPVIVAHDRRPAAAAMVYGGGDLRGLIRHNVRRYENAFTSEVVAGLGALLLRPIEPMRYAARISPTPLIMVNGTDDEQIPRVNTELFYHAAGQPKSMTWIESRHVNRRNVELTKKIVATLKGELVRIGLLEDAGPHEAMRQE